MATCSFMITNLSLSNPHAHVLILRATSCGLSGFIILKYLSVTSGYGSTAWLSHKQGEIHISVFKM